MGKLAKILEYAYANDSEKKKLLNNSHLPKDIKELLLSESMEEGTLINEGMNIALVAGAENRSVIRKVLPIVTIGAYNNVIPYNLSPSGGVSAVGEAASIPSLRSAYGSGSVRPKKYSVRVGITNEMIEDCRWDLVELEFNRAGALLENTLNRVGMTELLDGQNGTTPADIDPTHLHIQIQDLARAKESLKNEYWGGGNISFIEHPNAWRYIFVSGGNYLAPYISPNRGSQLMGMDVYELYTDLETDAQTYWDSTDATGHYYGIVLDSDNYAVIGMKEDIHIANQNYDPINDLANIIVQAKFDVKVINSKAAVRILTK